MERSGGGSQLTDKEVAIMLASADKNGDGKAFACAHPPSMQGGWASQVSVWAGGGTCPMLRHHRFAIALMLSRPRRAQPLAFQVSFEEFRHMLRTRGQANAPDVPSARDPVARMMWR